MSIVRGQKTIGLTSGVTQESTLPLPDAAPSLDEEIQRLIQRFSNLETLVERKADNNTLRSAIRISPEAILLEARDVGVIGTFTVADIINEQNGTTDGAVPISITQIRGDVIRTGTILSNNWGTTAGTQINLNTGEIQIGGSDNPSLKFLAGDLTISGKLTASSLILTNNRTLGQIATAADAALPASSFGSTLQSSLDAGVNNIIAGMSGDYRLNVGTTSIIAKHKDANEAGLGAGYSGTIRTGLIITANGIGMGYNDKTTGNWINAVSIGSTGDVSILGTLTAGSIITGTVTVDGVQLSTVRTNAATGSAHAGTTGNPHGSDLDDIGNGSTYFRTTANQVTGADRGYNALDSSFDYIRAISTQKIVVSASNPTNGVVIDSAGFRGYSGGVLKFNISTAGTAEFSGNLAAAGGSFSGDISAASGTFAGNINTSGILKSTGGTLSIDITGAIVGQPATASVTGVVGRSTDGYGVYGRSTNTTGVGGVGAVGVAGDGSAGGVVGNSGIIGIYFDTGVGVRGYGLTVGVFGQGVVGGRFSANAATGVALDLPTGYIARTKSTTAGVLEVWDTATNTSQGTFYYEFRS
jgi:hypothetical protein